MTLRPLATGNSLSTNFGQVNDMVRQLNNEQTVKVFKGPNNTNALINGRYSDTKYGTIISDSDGVRRVLIGQHPVDGHPGIWISSDGVDVITELEA